MPKVPFLIVMALALAGCNQSDRQTGAGGYTTYGDYLRSHQTAQAAPAPAAPVMTEDGAYAGSAPSGSIGADTLVALKATAPGAVQ